MSGKRTPKRSSLRTHERIAAEKIDVIVDQHQRALREARVDPAGGVGEQQRLQPETTQDADRERDGAQVVALVEVHASRQRQHGMPANGSADQPAGVPDHVRSRPVRNLGVVDRKRLGHLVGKRPEPRAKHEPDLASTKPSSAEELRRLDDPIEVVIRRRHRNGAP